MGVRMVAQRRTADWPFGSGWSFEWAWMTNSELTAEKRPALEDKSEELWE